MSDYILSPISPVVNDFPEANSKWKERNDRQLRLWGVHGQERIIQAHVCLLNATAVGSEVLKNIVLPGFGQFSIVDGKNVTPQDLGVNFYITKEGIGKNRAEVVSQIIAELNPEVQGSFLASDPEEVLETSSSFFDRFNFIIASNMKPQSLRKLAQYCYDNKKVLIIVRSYGMIGYIRTITRSHEIVEAKLDQDIDDLRISNPWPELLQFAEQQDYSKMDAKTHSHTPYLVILIKALKEYRSKHNGNLPSTRDEKEEFKNLIVDSSLNFLDEENFQEAHSKYFQAIQQPEIPQTVQDVFNDDQIKNLTAQSSDFWFMAAAVKKFVENEGQGTLPLQGRVPDMHADTDRYVKLQTLYRRKARSDVATVSKYLKELLKEHGRGEDSISDMDVKEFCKNSYYLRVIHFRPLDVELNTPNKSEIQMHLSDPNSAMPFYIMLCGVDRFYEKFGRYPGDDKAKDLEQDAQDLSKIVAEILSECEVEDGTFNTDAYVKEMVRYGACELHNISSLIGGVAGQELIKLCTKQRVPLNNTWIYNGISSQSTAFEA
jgi:amyloid beta precursor protein binding protein 1